MLPNTSSERNNDLAEHLAALEAREAALELAERNLGIDHRQHAGGHLGKALANVAHGGAERADDAILLLEELHQVERRRGARRCAAGHEPAAAPQAQQRAVEGLRADMLEHDVDALLGGELAHRAFEALGAIVDHVISAKLLRLLRL